MALPEVKYECSPVDPEFYQTVITKFSWWANKERTRVFVIAFIRYDDEGSPGKLKPATVGLLELKSEDPVNRPWQMIVDLYKAGELIKTSQPTPSPT